MAAVVGGTVDITPTIGRPLAGFSGGGRTSTQIGDRLEANLVAVAADPRPVVLCSMDLLYPGLIAPLVRAAVGESAELFVFASHTHFGPATEPLLPGLGAFDDRYVQSVVETLTNYVASMLTALSGRSASARYSIGSSKQAVGRRRPSWVIHREQRFPPFRLERTIWRAPSELPSTSNQVHAIRFVDPDSDPELGALLWSYPCHPTEYPASQTVSADFPGVVRARLRRRYGANLPVLFASGFSGDVRPRITSWFSGQSYVRRVENAMNFRRNFVRASEPAWRRWAEKLGEDVDRAFANPSVDEPIAPKWRRSELAASAIYPGVSSEVLLEVAGLRLSESVALTFLPGEPTTDLRDAILFPDHSETIGVGYADRTLGYLPGPKVLVEGGYEARGIVGDPAIPSGVNPGGIAQLRDRVQAVLNL